VRRLIPAAAAATLVLAPVAAFVVATAGPASAAGTLTITLTRATPTDNSTFNTMKGYTVTFVNADVYRHTITRTGGAWKSSSTMAIEPGKTAVLGPLSSAGTYTYSDRYLLVPAVYTTIPVRKLVTAASYATHTATITAKAPAPPTQQPAVLPTTAPSTGGGAAPGSGTGGGAVPVTGGSGGGGSNPTGTTPLAGGGAGPATSIGGGTRPLGSSNGAVPPTGTTGFSYGYGGTSLSGLPMLGVGNLSVPPPAGISGPAPAVAPLLPGDSPTADQPLVTGGSEGDAQATSAAAVGDLRDLGLPAAVAAIALVGMISLLVRALLAEPLENLLGARTVAP
jgi:plastocyanin